METIQHRHIREEIIALDKFHQRQQAFIRIVQGAMNEFNSLSEQLEAVELPALGQAMDDRTKMQMEMVRKDLESRSKKV